jgi:hypothetical protein
MDFNNLRSYSKSITFATITLFFDKTTLGSKSTWKSLNVSKGSDSWAKGFKGYTRNLKLIKTLYLKFGGSLDQAMILNINLNFENKIYTKTTTQYQCQLQKQDLYKNNQFFLQSQR